MSETHTPFVPPSLEELNILLPTYRFDSLIASGGMGAVYRGVQISLDREVAIKVLPRELSQDEEFRSSFIQEARAMAKLNHPHLIGVYDFGEIDGMQFIAMEYVPGQALYYSAYQQKIAPSEAIRIIREICAGLQNAHDSGLLHRDIKPANILLDGQARCKIGDFGLARPADNDSDGLIYGTPGYAAPEVTEAPNTVGPGTDLYAVGVMLYELLTGEMPPVDGSPFLASHKCQCDRRLDQIIAKATHTSQEKRYSSANDLSQDLDNVSQTLTNSRSLAVTKSATTRKIKSNKPSVDHHQTKVANSAAKSVENKLIRNLIVIALLLVGIVFFYSKFLKMDAEEKNASEESGNKSTIVAAKTPDTDIAPTPPSPVPPQDTDIETPTPPDPDLNPEPVPKKRVLSGHPLRQLEKIRTELKSGSREIFPEGSKTLGESTFFYVSKPLNWYQALLFAERHGAQLATLKDDFEQQSLSSLIPSDSDAWIGAGSNGSSGWAWTDNSPWELEKSSVLDGGYGCLTHLGALDSAPPNVQKTFIIEWQSDASNPGSLESQLNRITETEGEVLYPAGTFKFEKRRFLIVAKPMKWTEARSTAQALGGHLAVPATSGEAAFLKALLEKHLPVGKSCWIGLHRLQDNWTWITDEPFDSNFWGDQKKRKFGQAVSYMKSRNEPRWMTENLSTHHSYFLIEWDETTTDKPDSEIKAEIEEAIKIIEPFQKMRKQKIEKLEKEFTAALKKNTEDYHDNLNRDFKRFSSKNQLKHQSSLNTLIDESLKGYRIKAQSERSVAQLETDFGKRYSYHFKKQSDFVAAYQGQLKKINTSYIRKLNSLIDENDVPRLKKLVDQEAQAIEDEPKP